MKKQNGITLIALIVTIIVLLILAGVSINMISGDDGIIERASSAAEKTKEKTLEEEKGLSQTGDYIEDYVNAANGGTHQGTVDTTIAQFGRLHDNTIDLATYCVTNNAYPALIVYQDNVTKIKFFMNNGNGIYTPASVVWASDLKDVGYQMGQLPSAGEFIAFKIDDPNKVYNLKVQYEFADGTIKYTTANTSQFVRVEFAYKDASGADTKTVVGVANGGSATAPSVPGHQDGTYKYTFSKWVEEDGNTTANLGSILAHKKLTAIYTQELKESICFVAGTEVLTETGLVNIEDVKVGMKVYSYNEEIQEVELKEVKQTFKTNPIKDMVKVTVNGEVVESTSKHEYYVVGKGWTAAHELKEGDVLLNSENEEIKVETVELIISNGNPVTVYNMEVEDNHNYFVGEENVLVHNAGSPC